jgi:hypothetical protein
VLKTVDSVPSTPRVPWFSAVSARERVLSVISADPGHMGSLCADGPGPPDDRVYPFDLEPPRPPADGADRTEQDGTHGRPQVTGLKQQKDLGPEPDLGVGRPAAVGEEVLAFRPGEMDTGHESAPPRRGDGRTGQRTRTAGSIRDRTPQQEVAHGR